MTLRAAGWAVVLAACSSPTASDAPDGAIADAQADAEVDPGELRGIWITRFAYTTQAQLEGIIDRAAEARFNAVFVQVRGDGDAYYRSDLAPWGRRLTGVLGRDPGWDPLQVAIDRAHGHGMQLHAYVNVFAAWPTTLALPVAEGAIPHVLVEHPDWLAVNGNGVNADPEYRWLTAGNPAVRAHVVAVITELLARYAVDGVHLDRIRQPGAAYSHDAVTEAAFTAAKQQDPALTFSAFMRTQVDLSVEQIHTALLATRPAAVLSAAVWGIYEPIAGCSTSQGKRDFHQDSLAWLDRKIVDAIAPMTYWSIEPGACTDWAALTDGFVAARGERHVWAGMHALDDSMFDPQQLRARTEHARAIGANGVMVYASSHLDEDAARWTVMASDVFGEPASAPTLWKL